MQTIQSRFPGEWGCTVCDVGHNGYLATQIWSRSWPPPKVCWKCVAKRVRDAARDDSAVAFACMAIQACDVVGIKAAEIRELLERHGVSRKGFTAARLSACVYRVLLESEAVEA